MKHNQYISDFADSYSEIGDQACHQLYIHYDGLSVSESNPLHKYVMTVCFCEWKSSFFDFMCFSRHYWDTYFLYGLENIYFV